MATAAAGLPHFARGEVVRGFGRGSKELGCPTANFPKEVVDHLPENLKTGVYYGFASVGGGEVHKMVMNIGWNPFYNNKEKSMETHIIHTFAEDFYGKQLSLVMLGYLRPEMNFTSVEGLIKQINDDIETSKRELDKADFAKFREHPFFSTNS